MFESMKLAAMLHKSGLDGPRPSAAASKGWQQQASAAVLASTDRSIEKGKKADLVFLTEYSVPCTAERSCPALVYSENGSSRADSRGEVS